MKKKLAQLAKGQGNDGYLVIVCISCWAPTFWVDYTSRSRSMQSKVAISNFVDTVACSPIGWNKSFVFSLSLIRWDFLLEALHEFTWYVGAPIKSILASQNWISAIDGDSIQIWSQAVCLECAGPPFWSVWLHSYQPHSIPMVQMKTVVRCKRKNEQTQQCRGFKYARYQNFAAMVRAHEHPNENDCSSHEDKCIDE